jgi:hypothetical protein
MLGEILELKRTYSDSRRRWPAIGSQAEISQSVLAHTHNCGRMFDLQRNRKLGQHDTPRGEPRLTRGDPMAISNSSHHLPRDSTNLASRRITKSRSPRSKRAKSCRKKRNRQSSDMKSAACLANHPQPAMPINLSISYVSFI